MHRTASHGSIWWRLCGLLVSKPFLFLILQYTTPATLPHHSTTPQAHTCTCVALYRDVLRTINLHPIQDSGPQRGAAIGSALSWWCSLPLINANRCSVALSQCLANGHGIVAQRPKYSLAWAN